jgi:hypothetical protein
MGPRRIAMLLMLAASQACAQPAATQIAQSPPPSAAPLTAPTPTALTPSASTPGASTPGAPADPVKRIFTPPPVQWDNAMLSFRPALSQTATDFAILTGGLAFGMSPTQVNARLPEPYPGLSWNGLPMANEYPGEARYFGMPIDRAGSLRMDLTACAGATSYLVFLFSDKGLFRLSYRLTADTNCTDTNQAVQQIFARYVPIDQTVAISARYHTGKTDVVDITDPTARYLAPIRWRQGVN